MSEEKQEARRRIRLNTPGEIRVYIASLIRRVEAEELDLSTARTLQGLAGELLKAYRTDVIEQRIMIIEDMIENGTTGLPFDGADYEEEFLRGIE